MSLEETNEIRRSERPRRPPRMFTYDVIGEPSVQMISRNQPLNPLAAEFCPAGSSLPDVIQKKFKLLSPLKKEDLKLLLKLAG